MRVSCALVAAAVAAGCGPAREPPRAASAGSAAPAGATTSPGNSAGATPAAQPVPAEERARFRPVLQAVGDRTLYVEQFKSLLLFDRERQEAQQIIASWARAIGFKVLPPAQVQRTLALGQQGKDPATGAVCGPPLDRALAVARWLPKAGVSGHLAVSVGCVPTCIMQLEIQLDGLGTEFFAAPFDPAAPWRAELARRLRQLVDNGGHDRYGHGNNPVSISGVQRRAADTDWLGGPGKVAAAPAPARGAIQGCKVGLMGVRVLIEHGAGKPPRCQRYADPSFITDASPALNSCVCKALAPVVPADSRRRVFEVEATRKVSVTRVTSNGKSLSASIVAEGDYSSKPWTERWFFAGCDGSVDCGDLGQCFADRTQAHPLSSMNVTIDFDGKGTASKVTPADITGELGAPERACIVKRLLNARIPCPGGPAHRTGRIWLQISDPPHPAKPGK